MNQPLIIAPTLEFQKLAAETTLPEDPNQWSDEVLQELYKQVPYLADFDLNVVMETVDGERGYGLGHVEVSNKTEAPMTSPPEQLASAGVRTSRIPVIIKDSKLMPFDIIMTDDSRALPLTESRLRQAMFRPQNFDVTSKTPGDQSMIGQLYPPYRQNYGFGGGGVTTGAGMGGKTASKVASSQDNGNLLEDYLLDEHRKKEAGTLPGTTGSSVPALEAAAKEKASCGVTMKTGSVLEAVLSTVAADDLHDFKEALLDQHTKLAFLHNVAAYEALERIGKAEPVSLEKRAAAALQQLTPSVLQVVHLADGYAIKTASHLLWSPVTEVVDRGVLVQRVGPKIALAADLSGSVTVSGEPGVAEDSVPPPGAGAGPISAPGMYQVQTVDGEMLSGVVLPNLLDIDGTSLPISLFTDGQHAAVQSDMAGVPVGEFAPPGTMPADQASGHGVFISIEGGVPSATLPLTLGATVQSPGTDEMPRYQAETFDGRQVQVSVQPYVHTVVGVDGVMLIPEGWAWLPLDAAGEVDLVESAGEVGKVASLKRKLSSVHVLAGGPDCFALRGHLVDKLAADERTFLTQDQAVFVLTALGADPRYAQTKLAQALGTPGRQADVQVSRSLKLASEVRGESYTDSGRYLDVVPTFRHRMWKEAATIPDPTAVDAVLSLGFINPENLATFVGYLPTLDEAQRRLCELLIGARLGMRELSEGALERAIRALEDVIEGLKVIAFQG